MSIQVTNNGDGTLLTVTCGAGSMTVVTVTTDPRQGSAGGDDRLPLGHRRRGRCDGELKWPLVTIGGGGVMTSLVQTLGHGLEVDHKVVGSQGEMVVCLESLGEHRAAGFAA